MALSIPPAELQYMRDHPHQSYAPQLIISTAICCSAAIFAVGLRFLSRHVVRVKFDKDDYAIVVALVLSLTYSFLMVSLVPLGFGKHIIYLQPEDGPPIGRRALAALVILSAATYAIKTSVLLLYARIFPSQRFRYVLYGVGAVCTAFFLASFFTTLFECTPVGAQLSGAPHTCINLDDEFDGLSFINSFLDFTLLCLPLPSIWRLHMSTARKLQTTAIFGLGALACVSSLIRAVYTLRNSAIDTTYDDARTAAWVTVEINVSVVSACLPNLGPLVYYLQHRRKPSTSNYFDGSNGSGYKSTVNARSDVNRRHGQSSNWADSSSATKSGIYETSESIDLPDVPRDKAQSNNDQRPLVGQSKKPGLKVPGTDGQALHL